MQINICQTFSNLSPFEIRRQRYNEVLLLIRRLNNKVENKEDTTYYKNTNGKKRYYVPVKE